MPQNHHPSARRGFSLIEVLVAVTLTLILMAAVVRMFGNVSREVSRGRAGMELAGNLRGVVQTLRNDLGGVTPEVKPWPTTGSGEGYLEYSEFVAKDNSEYMYTQGRIAAPTLGDPTLLNSSGIIGDFDDVLAFTARARNETFRGRVRGGALTLNAAGKFTLTAGTNVIPIESPTAEIVYFTRFDDRNGNGVWEPLDGEVRTLHRRTFLIRPDIELAQTITNRAGVVDFYQENDLSVRVAHDGSAFRLHTNALADLTHRENRFGRRFAATTTPEGTFSSQFPHELDTLDAITLAEEGGTAPGPALVDYALRGDRQGEDVIATNVTGFDVRAFDPTAVVRDIEGRALQPGDFGYDPTLGTPVMRGAFVDLGYGGTGSTLSQFAGLNHGRSQIRSNRPTYCTWSQHYEYDGLNQDSDATTDEGTNDADDDNSNGADDPNERETAPPYASPLRAIQVTVRVMDVSSHQIRQSSVTSNFTPE